MSALDDIQDDIGIMTEGAASAATSFFKNSPTARPSCAISLNFNNLRGSITQNVSTIANLSGIIGTPAGLVTALGSVKGVFTGIGGKLKEMVGDILPDISLREQLEKLSKEVGLDKAVGKMGEIAEDFSDATGLEGFVDLNLTDLSKSAFSLGTTFDPCKSTIPNLVKSAEGLISSKPAVAPNLGSEEKAVDNNKKQKVVNSVQKAKQDNISLQALVNIGSNPMAFINAQVGSIQSGAFGSISAMGGALRKSLTGQQFLESRANMVLRIGKKKNILSEFGAEMEPKTAADISSEEPVNTSNFPTIFSSAEEEAAHDKFVAETIAANRFLMAHDDPRRG